MTLFSIKKVSENYNPETHSEGKGKLHIFLKRRIKYKVIKKRNVWKDMTEDWKIDFFEKKKKLNCLTKFYCFIFINQCL